MKEVKSFGIIPILKKENELYTTIVKNQEGHTGLPKGTPEGDESPIETARRELLEETGISKVEVNEKETFEEKYSFEKDGIQYNKTNVFYIGFVEESENFEWIKLEEAKERLTYQEAKNIVDSVIEYLTSDLQRRT
jgi:bis(5'-nucleosidyl)-tetraphosphatase